MNYDIEVITTVTSVLSKVSSLVGLVDGLLELALFVPELSSHIDVSGLSSHRESDNQSSFYQFVRVVTHNFPVLTGSWLRFISVDNQVRWSAVRDFGHERVLES